LRRELATSFDTQETLHSADRKQVADLRHFPATEFVFVMAFSGPFEPP
jgi:hypothetical protein